MENVLPTYQMATSHDHWIIIAPYIASPDLCSAALVCNRWHEMFAPHLWGNPASHFGTENDAVYVALTRFKRTLAWARLYVRRMTHTFHLPPAHPEMYEGPHSDWLRDVLERLPNMQSLIVNGLPFFDHAALLTLRHRSSLNKQPRLLNVPPLFSALRFLDAQKCANATPIGLTEALKHFPGLLYVDLSSTVAAKAPAVLTVIGNLPNLQILKLNNIGLKDEDVKVLTSRLGLRIRSLDLRNNFLTDTSVRLLLAKCFKIVQEPPPEQPSNFTESGLWPSRMDAAYIGEVLRHAQDEELDRYLRKRLTSELVDRLAIEDTPPSGITHFYISGNRLTAEGILALLRLTNLNVLDAGDVARELPEMTGLGAPPDFGTWESLLLPGAEKLIPVIAAASRDLTYLRINHALLTGCAPASGTAPPPLATPPPPLITPPLPSAVELPVPTNSTTISTPIRRRMSQIPTSQTELDRERAELGGEAGMMELNADPDIYELPTNFSIPELPGDTVRMSQRYELPGDTVRMSRRFELYGSAPHVYTSDEGDNLYSDPSEMSWNSVLSEQPTISSFGGEEADVDDDDKPSLVINASGRGLTEEASAMNGTSSPPVTRRLPPKAPETPYEASPEEWSWDSSRSDRLNLSSNLQTQRSFPTAAETTHLPEAISRSDTLDSTLQRFASESSTRLISPVDIDVDDRHSSLIVDTSGRRHTSTATNMNRNSTLSPILDESLQPTIPRMSPPTRICPLPPIPTNLTNKAVQPQTSKQVQHQRSYSSIITERRARVAYNTLHPTILRPSMLPHLRTLILTSLPATSTTTIASERLKDYISACAEEASLAHLQAQLGYAMPPGQRGRLQAQREYARSIFALERIVLEIAPQEESGSADGGGRRPRKKQAASWRKYPTKSSTEDADSERFWDAAQYDFSFFGDEECGQPAVGPSLLFNPSSNRRGPAGAGLMVVGEEEGRVSREVQEARNNERQRHGGERTWNSNERSWNTNDDEQQQQQQSLPLQPPPQPSFDLVAEIAKFRRERKAAYETAQRAAAYASSFASPTSFPSPFSASPSASAFSGGAVAASVGQQRGRTGSLTNTALFTAPAEIVPGYWEGEVKVVRLAGGA